jgi:hypothetical protein
LVFITRKSKIISIGELSENRPTFLVAVSVLTKSDIGRRATFARLFSFPVSFLSVSVVSFFSVFFTVYNKKRKTEDSKKNTRKRKRHNDWDFRHKISDSFRNNYVALQEKGR